MSEENIETPVAEEAPKKNTRAKRTEPKAEEPKAAPAPKRENPIPGAPELDGKFPGDEGYKYGTAVELLVKEIRELADKSEELQTVLREVQAARPKAKPMGSGEIWETQQKIQKRIRAEEDAKKVQIAAVLKEMNLL